MQESDRTVPRLTGLGVLGLWGRRAGLLLALLCVVTLVCVAAFGPDGANPIGLGFLSLLGTPMCLGMAIVGQIVKNLGTVDVRPEE